MKVPSFVISATLLMPMILAGQSVAQEDDNTTPANTSRQWLLGTIQDSLTSNDQLRAGLMTTDEVRARQTALRAYLQQVMPALPRTSPVKASVTDTIPRDGYTIEKVLIEAEPFHHVTALFYRPDPERYPPPWPGVVVACGHAHAAKGYPEYQKAGALCALFGLAALVFDPLDQGERIQTLDSERQQRWWGTTGHNISGGPALLLGTSQAAYQVRDGAAAIDYLQSRPDVDGDKIGVMGNSGGGTQTALLMVMDDRVKAAAPSCYITAFQEMLTTIGPQDAEQFLPGQIAEGFDHAEFLWARAPMPVLVCGTEDDFFPITGTRRSVDAAKGVFTTLGHPKAVELAVVPGEHGWHQPLRERSVEWMCRWLDDRAVTVNEPGIELLSEKDAWVLPTGKVLDLPGELSIHDLLRNQLRDLLERQEQEPWIMPEDDDPESVAIPVLATPTGLGMSSMERLPEVSHEVVDVSVEDDVLISRLELTCTPVQGNDDSPRSWSLPIIRMQLADSNPTDLRMIVRPAGVSATAQTERPTATTELLLVDPRFCGDALQDDQTTWSPFYGRFGVDGQPAVMLIMLGRSLPGVQTEDLLAVATWAAEDRPILLEAEGPPAVAARYAAALAPELFQEITVRDTPASWKAFFEVGNTNDTSGPPLVQMQFSTIIPGALPQHDLPPLDHDDETKVQP
ncbi:MAG: prolyl oligopeptidase family serine peptidase [Planctomycetota bacterium]|nr:prolyl oligopeptidase family serine peptidase [Planctomycetota bacterium]